MTNNRHNAYDVLSRMRVLLKPFHMDDHCICSKVLIAGTWQRVPGYMGGIDEVQPCGASEHVSQDAKILFSAPPNPERSSHEQTVDDSRKVERPTNQVIPHTRHVLHSSSPQ